MTNYRLSIKINRWGRVQVVSGNVRPCKGGPRCLMVMTSDFYAKGIWRFRVRVPAGVSGNLFFETTSYCDKSMNHTLAMIHCTVGCHFFSHDKMLEVSERSYSSARCRFDACWNADPTVEVLVQRSIIIKCCIPSSSLSLSLTAARRSARTYIQVHSVVDATARTR